MSHSYIIIHFRKSSNNCLKLYFTSYIILNDCNKIETTHEIFAIKIRSERYKF